MTGTRWTLLLLTVALFVLTSCSSTPPSDGASDLASIDAAWDATKPLLNPSAFEVVEDRVGICPTADGSAKNGARYLAFIETTELGRGADGEAFAADWVAALEQVLDGDVVIGTDDLDGWPQVTAEVDGLYFLIAPASDGSGRLRFG